jgi:hypothetical protein
MFSGDLLKGSSSPMVPNLYIMFWPPLLTFLIFLSTYSLHDSCSDLREKRERRSRLSRGYSSSVMSAWRFLGSLQLSCGDWPNLIKVQLPPSRFHSGWRTSFLVERLEENTLRSSWRLGCFGLHTTPRGSSTCKSVNFRIHRRLHMPQLFLFPRSLIYALYFVIDFVLEVIYLAIT